MNKMEPEEGSEQRRNRMCAGCELGRCGQTKVGGEAGTGPEGHYRSSCVTE